ncbi:hypothetical protein ANCCAN_20075 [Ancylostoma caninum]|uniref:Uncharacterized protein n=1 Tax=Ancylostoma caninum TaxID=29170 RepID=A0A368FRI1_ANCCA|nr:hypothetical protein ANCCAN_20075 [Ancylostoma caninum]
MRKARRKSKIKRIQNYQLPRKKLRNSTTVTKRIMERNENVRSTNFKRTKVVTKLRLTHRKGTHFFHKHRKMMRI